MLISLHYDKWRSCYFLLDHTLLKKAHTAGNEHSFYFVGLCSSNFICCSLHVRVVLTSLTCIRQVNVTDLTVNRITNLMMININGLLVAGFNNLMPVNKCCFMDQVWYSHSALDKPTWNAPKKAAWSIFYHFVLVYGLKSWDPIILWHFSFWFV